MQNIGQPPFEIAFIAGKQGLAIAESLHQFPIFRRQRIGEIEHQQGKIRIGHRLITTLDAQRLDCVLSRAKAGSVHQLDRNPFD